MIPSLDADLINHFRLRSDVRRMPFTELGCAAGAMALSRAHDHLRAYPDHKVAIVAVEIPSMTYLAKDLSVANLVSAALFGDGGAAALVSNDRGRFEILDARTHFFHDTPEMMGFHVTDEGFSIVLDKRVPQLLESALPAAVDAFLEKNGVERGELRNFLFHPGGRKILDTIHDLFGLAEDDLALSRETLREVGNLSSASVLFVLEKALAGRGRPGLSLLAAFGPGFNAELSWAGSRRGAPPDDRPARLGSMLARTTTTARRSDSTRRRPRLAGRATGAGARTRPRPRRRLRPQRTPSTPRRCPPSSPASTAPTSPART